MSLCTMLLEVVDNFALSELSHVSVMSLVQFKVLSMEILCVLAGKNKVENWSHTLKKVSFSYQKT